jgi:hypothetical protein
MPSQNPQTVYPFACSFFFLGAQIWVVVAGNNFSFTWRVGWMFIISAAVLVLFPILANIGGALGFWIVFAYLFFFSIIQGISQASIYQLSGDMPSKYMGAIMFGSGISGIVSNLLRALSLFIWPIDQTPSAAFNGVLGYSVFAGLILLCCGIGFFFLKRNNFALHYLK